MSDTVEIIKAVLALVTVVFTGVMAYQTVKLNLKAVAAATAVSAVKEKAEEAARIVKEVKSKLESTTGVVDEKLNTIHTLVNSNMQIQKDLYAVAKRQLAILAPTTENIAAAEMAEQDASEHMAKQAEVDGGVNAG